MTFKRLAGPMLFVCVSFLTVPAHARTVLPASNLMAPQHKASGRGDVTTLGSITAGSNELTVASVATWKVGQILAERKE